MFDDQRFRVSTWRLDAVAIWAGAISSVLSGAAALLEGFGMALSLLIAFAVLPLAFLTTVIVLRHKQIIAGLSKWFSSSGNDEAGGQQFMYDPQDEAPDITTYYDLMMFAVEYLLPACDAQVALHEAIIRRLCGNKEIAVLAVRGLSSDHVTETRDFWTNYNRILRGVDSSEPTIRYSAMVECIRGLERNGYRDFSAYSSRIAKASGLDFEKDEITRPLWEECVKRHEALVQEYNKIKNHPRFGKLFYPRREGRWGSAPAYSA